MTDRATGGDSSARPTQPARNLRAFADAFGRLGYDVVDLLAAAGLKPADLEDPDVHVPCTANGLLIARACERRPLRNLALHLALETPIGAFPLLDYLVVSSETVGEGFGQLIRYLRLVGSPMILETFVEDDFVRVVATSPGNPFPIEYTLALAVRHLGAETDGRLRIAALHFAHRPDDASEFERLLGCPVRTEAGWAGLLLPVSSWRLPMRRRDAALRAFLERQAKEDIARNGEGHGAAFEVSKLLATRVAGRDTRLKVLARQLGIGPRTLQRRLAAEGVSYQDLLERTRREAAEGYLRDSALSVGEIGYLLGYSEPAAFHRAFRRWHDITPAAFRRRPQVAPSRRT